MRQNRLVYLHAITRVPSASLQTAVDAVQMDFVLEMRSHLLAAKMIKNTVDVSATVLSVEDPSTTLLNL